MPSGPVVTLGGSRDIRIDRLTYQPGAPAVIIASGANNANVTIKNTDLKSAKQDIELKNGATRESFKIE